MKATAKDLRFHTGQLLETVRRGEEVVITFRGRPCARLVPIEEEENKKETNDLFGMWKDHDASENVEAYVRNARKGRFA
jgi:prevent-host-death family protein